MPWPTTVTEKPTEISPSTSAGATCTTRSPASAGSAGGGGSGGGPGDESGAVPSPAEQQATDARNREARRERGETIGARIVHLATGGEPAEVALPTDGLAYMVGGLGHPTVNGESIPAHASASSVWRAHAATRRHADHGRGHPASTDGAAGTPRRVRRRRDEPGQAPGLPLAGEGDRHVPPHPEPAPLLPAAACRGRGTLPGPEDPAAQSLAHRERCPGLRRGSRRWRGGASRGALPGAVPRR